MRYKKVSSAQSGVTLVSATGANAQDPCDDKMIRCDQEKGDVTSRSNISLPLAAVFSVLAAHAATGSAVRTLIRQDCEGTIIVEEILPAATSSATERVADLVRLTRSGVIWQRTQDHAVYTTSSICRPVAVLAAGTYLNHPKQIEVIPIEGDETPDWAYSGSEFQTAASRDGSVIVGANCSAGAQRVTVYCWAPGSETPLWSTAISPATRATHRTVGASPDGSTIAVLVNMQGEYSTARLHLFDPASNVPIGVYDGPAGFARNFSVGEDGRFVAFIGAATAYVVDRDAGTIRWSGDMGATSDPLTISSDGNYLAYGWQSLRMLEWNGTTYSSLWFVSGNGYYLRSCAISSDGSTLVAGWYRNDFLRNRIHLFEMPSGTPLWTHLYTAGGGSYQDTPYDIAITADGEFFVVGSWGDQLNTNDEVQIFAHDSPEPEMSIDTPGSIFDVDIASLGGCSAYVTACGKHIHANETGNGGDLFSIRLSCPESVEDHDDPFGSVRFEALPNPFPPDGCIRLSLTDPWDVDLAVFSPLGTRIRTLLCGPMTGGTHTVRWDGLNERRELVPSGVYFVRFAAGDRSVVSRTVVLR